MVFGAVFAFKKIDAKVEATLQEAAEILKSLQVEEGTKSSSSSTTNLTNVPTVTHDSHQVISIEYNKNFTVVPKPTIRTPEDARKERNIYFPPAELGSADDSESLLIECPNSNEGSSDELVSATPDTLFPSAIYIPAKGKPLVNASISSTSSSSRETTNSFKPAYRMLTDKLATEPLEDIKYLKCSGIKKSKPDDLFPKATYTAGSGIPFMAFSPSAASSERSSAAASDSLSNTATSANFVYMPMEFVSTDGRTKMLLQVNKPLEEKTKKQDCEEFPIVPEQLQSNTKLNKDYRTKFSFKISVGDSFIDLSGIFNGNSMKKNDLAQLVINGQSYRF